MNRQVDAVDTAAVGGAVALVPPGREMVTVLPASATPLTVPPSGADQSVGAVGGAVVHDHAGTEPDSPLCAVGV